MHYGSVPFDMNTAALGLPDHRQRVLPDAEREPGPLARHGAAAVAGLPRPARASTRATSPTPRATTSGSCWPACGWRARSPRRRRWPSGSARELAPGPDADDRRRTARLHPQDAQHRLPPGGHGADGPDSTIRWRCSTRGCGCGACVALRIADGSILPFLPAINPCITTMMIGEKCADMLKEDAREGARQ